MRAGLLGLTTGLAPGLAAGLATCCLLLAPLSLAGGCAGELPSTGSAELDQAVKSAGARLAKRAGERLSKRDKTRATRSAVVELRAATSTTEQTTTLLGDALTSSTPQATALGSGLILTADGLVAADARVVKAAGPLVATLADGRSFAARTVHVDGEVAVLQLVGAEGLPTVSETTPREPLAPKTPGWLGVALGDSDAGAVIEDVPSGTPAATARLEVGDVVVALDRDRLRTAAELREQISARSPGERVRLKILRHGKSRSVRVTVGAEYKPDRALARAGERDAASRDASRQPEGDRRLETRRGERRVAAQGRERGEDRETPLYNGDEHKLGISALATEDGLLVERVTAGGFADQLGIRAGSTILAINGVRLYEPDDIADALRRRANALEVTIRSGDDVRVVTLKRRASPPDSDG